MTKMVLSQMKNRKKNKSAIINVSSVSAIVPCPYISVYSATKAFDNFFSQALEQELDSSKIDVLSLLAGSVDTKLNRFRVSELITPVECATGCLKALGKSSYSSGHYKHSLIGYFISLVPEFLIKKIFTK